MTVTKDTVTMSLSEYNAMIKRLGGQNRVNWLLFGQRVIDHSEAINVNPDELINRIEQMWKG